MTIQCPTCNESAEHKVYRDESDTLPAGPEIRVCHSLTGAYIHVLGGDDDAE